MREYLMPGNALCRRVDVLYIVTGVRKSASQSNDETVLLEHSPGRAEDAAKRPVHAANLQQHLIRPLT
ncbi:hypothetical protein [Pseudogulbenkiania sp. MAI-1]|uniref:hypothetical protein n=1 Tax=Pseudogulbenkiania sp. MAI-1 TaxID=990370 RepID=UPI0012EB7FCA|nr:hypothetical protein [Pseudogulbenkiania sp. MAI-1]